MNTNNETEFLHKARSAFMHSLDQLDAQMTVRLRAARARAVETASAHRSLWHRRPWALPAGAMTVLLVALASGVLWWNQNPQPGIPFATGSNNNEDMSIVLSNDNLDMYADLDFYRWLQAQQQNPPQTDSGSNNSG
jgi:hypothetical protein